MPLGGSFISNPPATLDQLPGGISAEEFAQLNNLGTAAFRNVGNATGNVPAIPVAMSNMSSPVKATIDGITELGNSAAFHEASDFAPVVDGKIVTSYLPDLTAVTALGEFVNQAAMLASSPQHINDFGFRTDIQKIAFYIGGSASNVNNWVMVSYPLPDVSSVNGQIGDVILGKSDMGLENADNTSDENKPVSLLQSAAIEDAKAEAQDFATQAIASVANNLSIGNIIATSAVKTTPIDADILVFCDSQDLNTLKHTTWLGWKNALKTYFDTIYQSASQVASAISSALSALTTASVPDSTNKRYVTDAKLTVLNNTSNTNTGDETQSTINSKIGYTPEQPLTFSSPLSRSINTVSVSTGTTAGTVSAGNHGHSDATTGASGYMSAADKTKLNSISAVSYFNGSGAISAPTKVWAAIVTPNTTSGYSINISSAGFASILAFSITPICNTGTATAVPLADVKSVSNTAIVVNIIDGTVLIALGATMEFSSTTGLTLSVKVEGT